MSLLPRVWGKIALSCVIFTGACFAQSAIEEPDGTDEPTALGGYLELAAENNCQLRSAYERWWAALADVDHSATLPDPRLSYGLFIQEVETRVGPQKHRLGVSQKIPWLGKLRYRRCLAQSTALLAEEQLIHQYLELSTRLRKALYEHHYLCKSLQITKANIQLMELVEQVAQSQVRVGGSSADVLQAQMELSRLKDRRDTLSERITISIAQVNALLNRELDHRLRLPNDLFDSMSVPELISREELGESSPRLRVLCAQVAIQEQSRCLARQSRYPDITVGVDWIQTDHALVSTPDSGKDPVVAMVSANIPLWQCSYCAQEDAACHRKQSVESQYSQLSYELHAELQDLVLKYGEMEREITLYEQALIPQAEQTLSILQEAYEGGSADFDRYLGAQRILLDFQLKLERAKVDKAVIAAEFELLMGHGAYEGES